ncbi:MFS transporter [Xylaria curta]|nr:MFS transporter [Xylaria curta]
MIFPYFTHILNLDMAVLAGPAVFDDDIPRQAKDFPQHKPWTQSFLLSPRLDDDVCRQNYAGKGTDDDPYIVDYLSNDNQDAMNFSKGRKWAIAILQSLSTFAVTFASSVYVSGLEGVVRDFDVSEEVATLGLSLFVLGFALGPLIWAPLSELYGRRSIFVVSYTAYVAFSVAAAYAPNITALLVLRFLASAFGSSSMTNTGGIIADMFSKAERGLATGLFVTAPFLGPAFGPIAGGFLNENVGWRWILRLIAILGGVVWIAATLVTRETYAPFILRCRAKALSRMTGCAHVSRLDAGKPPKTLSQELSVSFTRPWILLFREPIVLLASLYVSIVYGTLYMFFAGFPLIFQVARGWDQGIAGLPFIGVAVGVFLATLAAGVDNKRYVRLCAAAEAEGRAVEPEARLATAMVGSFVLPIGLFLFAWTTYPWVHWILPVIGATLFSCGLIMVFISLLSYLVDTYVVYAASVLAANTLLRSLFGTAFPLFTTQIYKRLGNQWASSIPAFLVLGCLPFPFLFYKYGPQIRAKCKYASEAAKMLELMRRRHVVVIGGESSRPDKEPE